MTDPVMLLSQVHGEGRITYRALKEAGYETLESVARAEVHVLADQARLSAVTALRLKSGAQHMMGRAPVDGATRPTIPGPPERAHQEATIGAQPPGDRLSEGVLAEEAVLLGSPSGGHGSGIESATPAPILQQHPVDPEPDRPQREHGPAAVDHPAMPDIPATTRAASAHPDPSSEAPPSKQPAEQTVPTPQRSFWSFGGPGPRR